MQIYITVPLPTATTNDTDWKMTIASTHWARVWNNPLTRRPMCYYTEERHATRYGQAAHTITHSIIFLMPSRTTAGTSFCKCLLSLTS